MENTAKGEKIIVPPLLIELKPSKIDGIGVFAVPAIKKDQKVADGIYEEDYESLIPWNQFGSFDEEIQKKIMDFCVGTPEGFIPPEDMDLNKLSVEWYFNHSCGGNLGFNENGDFVAHQDIKKGEELTYDYGLAESNPKFRMVCKCASKNCRGIVTGNDWKDQEFRKKNLDYMLPTLRKRGN